MAYEIKQQDDDENTNQQQPAAGPEKVLTPDGGSQDDGKSSGGASTSGPQTEPGAKKGSGWTNLVSYVNANKEAGQEMAGKVAGTVTAQGQSAQQAGQTFGQGAAKTIADNTTKRDQSVIDNITKDPTKVTRDQFQTQANATYTGPQQAEGFEGYQDANKAYQTTASDADNLEDFEARRGVIAQSYAPRSDYTAGESRLDSFLTGAGGGDTLAQTRGDWGTGSANQQGWSDLLGSVTGQATQAKAAAEQTAADAQKAYADARGAIDKRFDDVTGYAAQAAKANTKSSTQVQTLERQLAGNAKQRAAAYASMGLDPQVGEWMLGQGYGLKQLIQAAGKQTGADFASKADIDRLQALYGLIGDTADAGLVNRSGSAGGYSTNAKAIDAATKAKAEQDAIAARLKTQQAARAKDADEVQQLLAMAGGSGLAGGDDLTDAELARIGIDRGTLDAARAAGINLGDYYSRGRALTLGDVATNADRKGWTGLMTALGLTGKNNAYMDSGDEGAAWAFDRNRLAADIAARTPAESAQASRDTVSNPIAPDPINVGSAKVAEEAAEAGVNPYGYAKKKKWI